MEAAGAFSGPVGGAAGAWVAEQLFAGASPWVKAVAVPVGIYLGDKYTGDLAKEFVYGEWIQATAPAIPADANLQPAQTINGVNYYVVLSEDKNGAPRTYVYTDSLNSSGTDPLLFPGQPRYIPVVDQTLSTKVVDQVLTELGYDPKTTPQQWNVSQGLSPSGYALDTVHYEHSSPLQTLGAGSDAQQMQNVVQVTAYRDLSTGAFMETRVSGQMVDGQFQASGTGAFTSGMDAAGRYVLTGDAAQSIAAAQISPQPDSASGDAVTVSANVGATNPYTSVSIQNHDNGSLSYDFVREDGSHVWVLSSPQTGERTVVTTNADQSAGRPATMVNEFDATGERMGTPRYYDAVGQEVNYEGAPLHNVPSAPGLHIEAPGSVSGAESDNEPLNTDATLTRPDPSLTLNLGDPNSVGLYHWGTLGGYNVLPFTGQNMFLTDNDGELVGEVNELPNGDYQVKYYLTGQTFFISDKDGTAYGANEYSLRHPGESPPQNPPHVSPYSAAQSPAPEANSTQTGGVNGTTGNLEPPPHRVYYTTPADSTPLTVGVGAGAQQVREVVQITAYTDPVTGAQMQTRVPGRLADGQFEATGGAFTTGVDALGRTVLSGDAVATIAAVLTTPSAEATPGVFRRSPRTHTHLDRHNTRHCPGVGTKNPLTSSSK